MFLDNIDLEEIKEKVFINHVVDSGTRDALIMRMRELLKLQTILLTSKKELNIGVHVIVLLKWLMIIYTFGNMM